MKKTPTPTKANGVYGEQLSFLPTLSFSPKCPPSTTCIGLVLAALLNFEFIAFTDVIAGCTPKRFTAYINKLKTLGWPVVMFKMASPTASRPNRSIALYGLHPAIIYLALSMRGVTC